MKSTPIIEIVLFFFILTYTGKSFSYLFIPPVASFLSWTTPIVIFLSYALFSYKKRGIRLLWLIPALLLLVYSLFIVLLFDMATTTEKYTDGNDTYHFEETGLFLVVEVKICERTAIFCSIVKSYEADSRDYRGADFTFTSKDGSEFKYTHEEGLEKKVEEAKYIKIHKST
ncbi:hypothetical protein H6758_02235 [Candidatus Nomurabacteria bacterium]|nr:hypothetical protein [Candidatus Nomurabacteria bacterium]